MTTEKSNMRIEDALDHAFGKRPTSEEDSALFSKCLKIAIAADDEIENLQRENAALKAQVAELKRADDITITGLTKVMEKFKAQVARAEAAEAQVAELEKENKRILATHVVVMKEADRMRDELIAQVAELRKDAERLDWIEKHVSAIRDIGWLSGSIREKIDAAKESGNG